MFRFVPALLVSKKKKNQDFGRSNYLPRVHRQKLSSLDQWNIYWYNLIPRPVKAYLSKTCYMFFFFFYFYSWKLFYDWFWGSAELLYDWNLHKNFNERIRDLTVYAYRIHLYYSSSNLWCLFFFHFEFLSPRTPSTVKKPHYLKNKIQHCW